MFNFFERKKTIETAPTAAEKEDARILAEEMAEEIRNTEAGSLDVGIITQTAMPPLKKNIDDSER